MNFVESADSEEGNTSHESKKWKDLETRILLNLWKKHHKLIKFCGDPQKRVIRSTLHNLISKALASSGFKRNIEEISEKMTRLCHTYRGWQLSKTPMEACGWEYYDAMRDILGLEDDYRIHYQHGRCQKMPTDAKTVPEVKVSEEQLKKLLDGSITNMEVNGIRYNAHIVKVIIPKSTDKNVENLKSSATENAPAATPANESKQCADVAHSSEVEVAPDIEHLMDTEVGDPVYKRDHRTQVFRARKKHTRLERPPSATMEGFLSEFRRSNAQLERHGQRLQRLLQANNEIFKKQNRLLSLLYTK